MSELRPVTLDLAWLRRALTWVVVILVVLHALVLPILTGDGGVAIKRAASIVNLDEERSVGTLVSALLLSAAAGLSWFHARHAAPRLRRGFAILALALGFVALDDVATIHEGLDRLLGELTDGEAFLTFLWVVPYGIMTLVLLVILSGFLRNLDPPVRTRLVAGGALFVAGAIGVEILGSFTVDAYGFESVQFLGLTGIEEGLELTGVSVALMGLLRQLGPQVGPLLVVDGDRPVEVVGTSPVGDVAP